MVGRLLPVSAKLCPGQEQEASSIGGEEMIDRTVAELTDEPAEAPL
jgi:hypothetical protein